jgi:tRNA(Ile)-lysidine synthase
VKGVAERTARFFERHKLVGTPGIVAISGGPDSVALAAACRELVGQGRLRLAHLNHLLRGAESDADEAFVRALTTKWQLPLDVERRDVAALARERGVGIEEAARQVRYEWLTEVAHHHSAAWIATAHNADDQAETVLHHILRGTGLAGLAGIAERRPLAPGIDVVRPLLSVPRAEIEAFLRIEGIEARTDASNADVRFTRNRLRHELLPQLVRDYNPALVEVLGRLARQASQAQEAIATYAKSLLASIERPAAGEMIVLTREPLAALEPHWLREVVRLVWQREGWPAGEMTFEDWDRFVDLARADETRHDFPSGVRVRTTRHVVQLWRELNTPLPLRERGRG